MQASSVPEAKRRLRREMEARRRTVPVDVAERAARAVAGRLLAEARVREAGRIALYASLAGELPSRPLFEALAETGCLRLLPRMRAGDLEWLDVHSWHALRPGRFGVLEPAGEPVAPPGPGELALLPGLAFDVRGGRLGRGGGYYDRAFPKSGPSPWLVGVGYRFQCVEEVPCEERDRRVDAIVHEAGFHWRRQGS